MNRHPWLKSFLKEKVSEYDVDVVFPGGTPYLYVLDEFGTELEKHSLVDLKPEKIVQLLESKGFGKIK